MGKLREKPSGLHASVIVLVILITSIEVYKSWRLKTMTLENVFLVLILVSVVTLLLFSSLWPLSYESTKMYKQSPNIYKYMVLWLPVLGVLEWRAVLQGSLLTFPCPVLWFPWREIARKWSLFISYLSFKFEVKL